MRVKKIQKGGKPWRSYLPPIMGGTSSKCNVEILKDCKKSLEGVKEEIDKSLKKIETQIATASKGAGDTPPSASDRRDPPETPPPPLKRHDTLRTADRRDPPPETQSTPEKRWAETTPSEVYRSEGGERPDEGRRYGGGGHRKKRSRKKGKRRSRKRTRKII